MRILRNLHFMLNILLFLSFQQRLIDIFEITNLHENDLRRKERKQKHKERRYPTIFANIFVLRKIMLPLNYIIRYYYFILPQA